MREPIFTDRLHLRDVFEADAALLFDLDCDPEVMRYIGSPPADVDWHRHRICTAHLPLQNHPWQGLRIVLDRASGEFVGWVFIRPATMSKIAAELGWIQADEVEIGYRYRRDVWGRGIATEAGRPLVRFALADPATSAVVGCAMEGNAASIRVLEKLGLDRVETVNVPSEREPVVKLARRR